MPKTYRPLDSAVLRSLIYFWEERGDLERCTSWDALQPIIEQQHPEIARAWREYKAIRLTITAVLRHAADQADRREEESIKSREGESHA